MRAKIQDQFTKLDVSPQRKWQLRQKNKQRCIICGAKAVTQDYCLEHATTHRERQRRYRSLTYRLADAANGKAKR